MKCDRCKEEHQIDNLNKNNEDFLCNNCYMPWTKEGGLNKDLLSHPMPNLTENYKDINLMRNKK